jgi:hypothetical protein
MPLRATDQSVTPSLSGLLGSIYPRDRCRVRTTGANRPASRVLRTDQSDRLRPTQAPGAIWPIYRFRATVRAEPGA